MRSSRVGRQRIFTNTESHFETRSNFSITGSIGHFSILRVNKSEERSVATVAVALSREPDRSIALFAVLIRAENCYAETESGGLVERRQGRLSGAASDR